MRLFLIYFFTLLCVFSSQAQTFPFTFGVLKKWEDVLKPGNTVGEPLRWIDVNTTDTTWYQEDGKLICKGLPIGVIRSEKQYENFILEVEWRHMDAGGNSGIFVWCDAIPDSINRLPGGVEVQMLELDWVRQHSTPEVQRPIAYVHGELFGAGGVTTTPDNPRGERSKSIENRCMGQGEWNSYTVVCIDGTIKLSVNGKFVNGIRNASNRKGYLCLESEGARIEFRNLQVIALDGGVLADQHIVDEL